MGNPTRVIQAPCRAHRAAAAFLAISDRRSGVNFAARLLPPLAPVRRACAVASDSGSGFSSCSWRATIVSTTRRAVSEKSSRFLAGFAMGSGYRPALPLARFVKIKLTHYRRSCGQRRQPLRWPLRTAFFGPPGPWRGCGAVSMNREGHWDVRHGSGRAAPGNRELALGITRSRRFAKQHPSYTR